MNLQQYKAELDKILARAMAADAAVRARTNDIYHPQSKGYIALTAVWDQEKAEAAALATKYPEFDKELGRETKEDMEREYQQHLKR